MIKTSSHSINYSNTGKKDTLTEFLCQYQEAVQFYVDYLWNNLAHDFRVPQFISTKDTTPTHLDLSSRALKCASTQACGIIRAATEKRRKQLYQLKKLMREGRDAIKLQRKIDKNPIIKPVVPYHMPAELNSICSNYQPGNFFDGFLELKSLGKKFGRIRIPIKHNKHSNKLKSQGKMMSSFLVQSHTIHFRWDIETPSKKTSGQIRGADQGISSCITLSDGQVTSTCSHGYDLHSIINKLGRKKKGSKAFKRAQEHRKNYVNWSINQLNFTDVKELRFEKLQHVGKYTRQPRQLQHFAYKEIKDKMIDKCQQYGVRFVEQNNVYRSQRCHSCGYVHKLNRKGKSFKCRSCGHSTDADLNAALNHEIDLMELPADLWREKLNIQGFYWHETGLLDSLGQGFAVSDTLKPR